MVFDGSDRDYCFSGLSRLIGGSARSMGAAALVLDLQ
jgi:hypothetical protein